MRKRAWLSNYGMALVLLALCAFFSVMTWGERQPTGAFAARQLAEGITGEHVIIVRPKTTEGEVFGEELELSLAEKDRTVVATLVGEPFEVRDQLETLLETGESFDTIAVHPTAYSWGLFDELARDHATLREATIVSPAALRGSSFLSTNNLLNITNQIAVIAIIAIGMTMVIITGGIDLSVGSLVAVSAVTTSWLIREYAGGTEATNLGMTLGALGGIGLCAAIGAGSGLMITRLYLPAFIVTLSVMLMASGLGFRISESQSIDQVPTSFIWLGRGTLLPRVPNAVVLMLALYALGHVVMTRTVFGRYIYAVGGNEKAAWLSGLPVNRVLVAVYALSGALAGLAGVVLASQLKSGAPTYGFMYEMYVIAAVVVGGTSLRGGEGRMVGTLIGALIIAVIQNGMNLLGIENAMQRIVLGAMVAGAVTIDSLQRGKEGR